MDKVRLTAVELLTRVSTEQSYSTISLQQVFSKHHFSSKDKGLLTELFYGTIQRQMTLDYHLEPLLHQRHKIDPWVWSLLRMSVYQMAYLDKIPDHAVLYEAVQIAKKKGHPGIAKFVNGVLRQFQRQGVRDFSEIVDAHQRLSISYSMPLWIVELLVEQYGFDETRAMCESLLLPPHLSVRIQDPSMSREELLSKLHQEGIDAKKSELSPRAVLIEEGDWLHSTAFQEGLMTVQDESSSLVAQVAELSPSDVVLDSCAAPGGKTTHIASYLESRKGGRVVALDLHANKLRKIQENASRLHVSDRVETFALDARKVSEKFEKETFDAVFVDAPCSGLGLMRRKPDIKYTKTRQDLENLSSIQLAILNSASEMVIDGGTLVYSTCTINKEENDEVVQSFLKRHPEFVIVPLTNYGLRKEQTLTILPQDYNSDGFYICRLKKINKSKEG